MLGKVEERLHVEVAGGTSNGDQGRPRSGLVEVASQLQCILVSLCSAPASTFLRRETAAKGLHCWRQLVVRYTVPTKSRARETFQGSEAHFHPSELGGQLVHFGTSDSALREKDSVETCRRSQCCVHDERYNRSSASNTASNERRRSPLAPRCEEYHHELLSEHSYLSGSGFRRCSAHGGGYDKGKGNGNQGRVKDTAKVS